MAEIKTVLSEEQKAQFVSDIIGYGTDFVTPLFALVDSIEAAVLSANAGKVDAWLPIESAPVGEEILVVATLYSMIYPEPQRVVAKKDSGNSWWAGPIPLSHVTKWMHLPGVTL